MEDRGNSFKKEQDLGEYLFREFCNHVYLGQWELSSAFALAITNSHKVEDSVKIKLKNVLESLSKNAVFAKNAWPVFPCPSYISFLSSQLLSHITEEEKRDNVLKLRNIAEFNVMLEETFPKLLESELKVFACLYLAITQQKENCSESSGEESTIRLSDKAMAIVQESLFQDPIVTSVFLNKLAFEGNIKHVPHLLAQICDIYYFCLLHLCRNVELSSITESPSKLQEECEKLCTMLPLLPHFSLEKDETSLSRLDEIFTHIIAMCDSETLNRELVYYSLVARSSPSLLQYYCAKEDEIFASQLSFIKKTSLFKNQAKDRRQFLLQTLKTNTHFLQNILDFSIKQILTGNFLEIKELLFQLFLPQLLPFLLILSLHQAVDSGSFSNVIEAIRLWQPNSHDDVSLVTSCQRLLCNTYFKDHCTVLYRKLSPQIEASELSAKSQSIYHQLQTQSPLSVLQRFFGLKNVPPQLVFDFLNCFSEDPNVNFQNTSVISDKDGIIYQSYLSIKFVVAAILNSCQLNHVIRKTSANLSTIQYVMSNSENSLDLETANEILVDPGKLKEYAETHGIQTTYSKFVVEPLNRAKKALSFLHPITLRIEMLENLFSLLFLSSHDLSENFLCYCDSDEGHESDEKYGSQKMNSRLSSGKNQINAIHSNSALEGNVSYEEIGEKRYSGRFVISQVKLKMSVDGKSEQSEFYSGHGSSRSTGSNSSNGIPSNGFLCNELIVRDLLNILKDALVDTKAQIFKSNRDSTCSKAFKCVSGDLVANEKNAECDLPSSIQADALQNHISIIEKYIYEAQWRYQLVTSGTFSQKETSSNSGGTVTNLRLSDTNEGIYNSSWKPKTKKKKRKLRMQKSDSVPKDHVSEPNIIQRMLSSPVALLRYCLWHQNYEKAFEVIDWCNLQSSFEASELVFAEQLDSLHDRLKKSMKIRGKSVKSNLTIERPQSSHIAAISDAAKSGLHFSASSSIISQVMSQWKIPNIPDVSEKRKQLSLQEKYLLSGASNMNSIVLADLAYTRSLPLDDSSVLLNMALQNWNGESSLQFSEKTKSKRSSPFLQGNLKFLQLSASLMPVFDSCSSGDNVRHSVIQKFFPVMEKSDSLSRCLINYFGSFDVSMFESHSQKWTKVSSCLEEFENLLQNEEVMYGENNQNNVSSKEKLHTAYKKLITSVSDMSTWSTEVVRPSRVKYMNYLKKLYNYMQQVAGALLGCKKQNIPLGISSYASYFSVLKESPSEILRKMVVQNKIPPEKVEKFAVGMKVDLAHILVDACFPKISVFSIERKVTEHKGIALQNTVFQTSFESPHIILNSPHKQWNSPKHPDLVARELAKDLVSMMQDIVISRDSGGALDFDGILALLNHSMLPSWFNDLSELAFVDLDLLQSREQLLAFFINVTNVAWICALLHEVSTFESEAIEIAGQTMHNNCKASPALPIVSPNLIERLVRQKALGFRLGQMGSVSLFDLRYNILHSHLAKPKHLSKSPYNLLIVEPNDLNSVWAKYLPRAEPRALFVLCEGVHCSPKFQVIYSEIISDQLDDSMKDFLNSHVTVDAKLKMVQLPGLLELYTLDFVGEKDSHYAMYDGLLNIMVCSCHPLISEQLKSFLSLNVPDKKADQDKMPFKIEFHPLCFEPYIKLDYCTDDCHQNLLSSSQMSSIASPDPVILNYLKERCSIIADIYSFISNDLETIQSLNSVTTTQSDDVVPSEFALVHYLKQQQLETRFFSADEKVCDFEWFVSALSPKPLKEYTLQFLQYCLINGCWEKAFKSVNFFLECHDNSQDFCFVFIRQLLLQLLASLEPSGEDSNTEPWCWALCISDPICRNETVLKNIQKWPESFATRVLYQCLSYNGDEETSSHLNTRLKEIEVFKKILDASKNSSKKDSEECNFVFGSWQDVAEYSIWDQSIVLNCIKASGQYKLAVEWGKLHIIDNPLKLEAIAMQIIFYLKQSPPQEQEVNRILEEYDSTKLVELASLVLPELEAVDNQLCFVKQLVDIGLEYSDQIHYLNMILGLKMLKAVNLEDYDKVYGLVAHPHLLLEQLLMNMEVKYVDAALKAIEQDIQSNVFMSVSISNLNINQLLENYAARAVELPCIDNLDDSMVTNTTILDSGEIPFPEQFVMPDEVPTKEQWVPDSRFRVCQACNEEQFNMFSRRHHCRRCGRVVCSNCSQNTLVVKGFGKLGVRVCDDCYNQTMCMTMNRSSSSPFKSSSFDKRYRILSSMKVIAQRNSPSQTFADYGESKTRTSSICLMERFYWALTTNPEQNSAVRNDFFFDAAPSVSLCLSILKLHSNQKQCAKFMLALCDRLIKKLKSQPAKKINPEVDYFLVIGMIKAFLVNAKLKYHQLHDEEGEEVVDVYLQRLDIIKMLVNENCTHLIPKNDLLRIETVRNVRDRLIEEEQMSLAIKISTSCGLDKSRVWASWGLFLLRAGNWETAKEKFQLCLKRLDDRNNQMKESPTLTSILNCLERSNYKMFKKNLVSPRSLSQSLEQIQCGITKIDSVSCGLDDSVKEVCLYYLSTYGSHFSTVAFYQRHSLLNEALSYIVAEKCEPEVFVEALFMPVLKCGELPKLQQLLTSNDVTLARWWNNLISVCRHLQRLGYMNVLYKIQIFMEDYIRAAKSSISFYLAPAKSFSVLVDRSCFLHNAKKHFETYLQTHKKITNIAQKSVMTMPIKEVESYIKTINCQEEVAKFLYMSEMQEFDILSIEEKQGTGRAIQKEVFLPTLFGNTSKKSEVVKMILANAVNFDEGFDLAAKIVNIYGLNTTAILCATGQMFVQNDHIDQLPHFLHYIKCCFSGANVDQVIMECITTLLKQGGDVDFLIKLLTSDAFKINAYLICGKLKNAYLLAIKLQRSLDVHRIMLAAEQSGQDAVKRFCEKWLQANSQRHKQSS